MTHYYLGFNSGQSNCQFDLTLLFVIVFSYSSKWKMQVHFLYCHFKTFSKILNPQMILVSISFAFFYICGSVCKSKTLFQSTFFFCAPTLVVSLRLGLQYTSYQGQKICIFWRKVKNLTNNKLDNNQELDDFIV